VQASQLDKSDIVTRINLIAAYLYLGELHHARAVVEEALSVKPNSVQLQGLRALILLDQEPGIDMWPQARDIIERLANSSTAPENILYNYTMMLIERNRHGKAKEYLGRLLRQKHQIPPVYRQLLCRQSDHATACLNDSELTSAKKITWKLPLLIGDDIGINAHRRELKHWASLTLRYGGLVFDLYTDNNGNSILAIDNKVELVTLKHSVSLSIRQLKQQAGLPAVISPNAGRSIWTYTSGWAAVTSDNNVEEIWVAK